MHHQSLFNNELRRLHGDVGHFSFSAIRAQACAACVTAGQDIKQVAGHAGKMTRMPVRAIATGVGCFSETMAYYHLAKLL